MRANAAKNLHVEAFVGAAVARYLPAIAVLRIEIFREWPYLYEGSVDYEAKYLASYTGPDAMVVIAFDGDEIVGASTAVPVSAHPDAVAPPLARAGFELTEVFYFGESVLRADRRGLGLGHRFFDEREAHARRLGYRHATFCAVERAADDPRRPPDYAPLDRFWTRRGFVKRPDIVGTFSWLDVGDEAESEKPMIFWVKDLEAG
ncbi:MAG: GNAT family N-acetyltransferase [Deltaproteobacteria bacterium]|nr:GNAT family N-acetyltransferase [Kofleriaceae bacterium]